MSRYVEWIEPGCLGQLDPISFEQSLREPEPSPPPNEKEEIEEEEKEIRQVERGLSTTEKVVIASLFLQVLTFAWGVFQFQVRENQRRREEAA